MPHIVVEYSSNLKDQISPDLLNALHQRVIDHGIEAHKIKTRMKIYDDYIVGDGDEARSFMHINFMILKGRGKELAQNIGNDLFASAKAYVAAKAIENCEVTQETRMTEVDLYNR